MRKTSMSLGFSLLEIVISLALLSLTAINVVSLQKRVMQQGHNNFTHNALVVIVTSEVAKIMQYNDIQEVLALNGRTTKHTQRGTVFTLEWRVDAIKLSAEKVVDDKINNSAVKKISINVSWHDSLQVQKKFLYSKNIAFPMLSQGNRPENKALYSVIENQLGTDAVHYFDPSISYPNNTYVIYNSQLFQATQDHFSQDSATPLIAPVADHNGQIAVGWRLLGVIDSGSLATLF